MIACNHPHCENPVKYYVDGTNGRQYYLCEDHAKHELPYCNAIELVGCNEPEEVECK